ncbi:hypothetical protein GCM10022415_12300 [Knoellia locipacati]|uniref:Zinc-ribbon domain-containing protein n=1 Tax=Knoellia locipacati TaxID=882824 RepID=A0A512SYY9_9MICO|nr:zinc ribbon domain-containing protein [Knoellia locipacati]GEQ13180.1 hypothetical protein KLO01_12270 [Knoellia locipacati]
MHCRSCGADLPVDSAFCSQCGARVELGSVLGVGTDLPAVRPQEQQPEDLSQTRELPRVDPSVAAAPAAVLPGEPSGPTGHPGHAGHHEHVDHAGNVGHDGHDGHDDGPKHSRNSILAMVATFAVLTIIGTFALTRLVGSDDPAPTTAASSSSSASEEAGDASPAPKTSASGSASPQVAPSASTSVPAGARRCSTSGSDSVATAYAGSERTSCEFAAAVRDAYRKAGNPEAATSLRAYSPVTKKWYSLSCDGGEPVRCTSTTNAIVLLAP